MTETDNSKTGVRLSANSGITYSEHEAHILTEEEVDKQKKNLHRFFLDQKVGRFGWADPMDVECSSRNPFPKDEYQC